MIKKLSMMTLEEAIQHCEQKACGNTECAIEHKQLAKWLRELQILKSGRSWPDFKPSNEQMNHLSAAVIEAQRRHNESVNGFPRYRVLKELYEQLKNL